MTVKKASFASPTCVFIVLSSLFSMIATKHHMKSEFRTLVCRIHNTYPHTYIHETKNQSTNISIMGWRLKRRKSELTACPQYPLRSLVVKTKHNLRTDYNHSSADGCNVGGDKLDDLTLIPWDPHGTRRELTPGSSLLTSSYMIWHGKTHLSILIYTHTHSCRWWRRESTRINKFNFKHQ